MRSEIIMFNVLRLAYRVFLLLQEGVEFVAYRFALGFGRNENGSCERSTRTIALNKSANTAAQEELRDGYEFT